jgi:hypothetical protein
VLRKIFGSREDYIKRSFMICIPHQILFGDQIKKIEKGEACSTHGERNVACLDLAGKPKLTFKKWDGRNKLN